MKIVSADFVTSAEEPSHYPGEGLPEVAFAGRSNVGKSSLINTLVNRKRLARVSSTPGHTRLINFHRINNKYMFADLPGYGYAKVSKKERERWKRMVETYLVSRQELKAAVLIMDLRRTPRADELDLIGFLTGNGITPVLVATKADKLGKTKRVKPLKEMAKALGIAPEAIIAFSMVTGEGRDALWRKLRELMEEGCAT
jgi:GTP-binding protein